MFLGAIHSVRATAAAAVVVVVAVNLLVQCGTDTIVTVSCTVIFGLLWRSDVFVGERSTVLPPVAAARLCSISVPLDATVTHTHTHTDTIH